LSYTAYYYSSNDCSGTPIATNVIPLTCSPYSGGVSQYKSGTCQTGQYVAPPNTLTSTEFSYSSTCAFNGGINVSYAGFPVNTCNVQGSGSGSTKYTCSATNVTFFSYTTQDCSGIPSFTGEQLLGVCIPGSSSGSSIYSCSGNAQPSPSASPTPSPSPGSSLSPTPTPSLSTGASPSTTPTFLPSTTPINSRITSQYTQVSDCGYISYKFTAGDYFPYACFSTDPILAPIMSILIYNQFLGSVSIRQMGFPLGSTILNKSAYAIKTTDGLNSITSSNEWISLGNITCTTNDNPSGICGLQFSSTRDFKVWLTVYRFSEVIANDSYSQNTSPSIIGTAAGGAFFLILILGALHAFRIIKVPCFNICCDRRALNQKAITTYPVVVTGGGKGSIQGAGV